MMMPRPLSGCQIKAEIKGFCYYIVCLFFNLPCPSCLANGKHHIEEHATKVRKKTKNKVTKICYELGRTLNLSTLSESTATAKTLLCLELCV
jgi:hypothetical protein